MENQNLNTPQALPNSTAILVLGILSIVLCFCYGIIGLALGIVAIVLANKSGKLYKDSPSLYTEGSYKNMKAGRVCAIVGVSLSALYLLYFIIVIIFYGAILTSMPWDQIMNP